MLHGDGGVAEGAFHEAVNIAAVWNLPVVYVIENNRYAASTHYSKNSKLEHLSDLAAAYGIPGVSIDGNDILKVYETATAVIDRARNGGGPTILETMTYRLTGHNRRDPCDYMPEAERKQAEANDPIKRFEEYLVSHDHLSAADILETKAEIEALVEQSVQKAMAADDPLPEDALKDVFV